MLWVLLGCLAVYLLFWFTDFDRQNAKMPRLLQSAKELGLATTPEEYRDLLAVPEEQNAAPIYREIAAKLEALRNEDPETVKYLSGLKEEDMVLNTPELDRGFAATEEIDELYRKAATYPACSSNSLDSEEVGDWPEMRALRTAQRLGRLRVRKSLLENDPKAALDRLEWMQSTLGHAWMEPTKLCLLCSFSYQSRWIEDLNGVVRHSHAVDGVLERAEALLDRLPAPPSIREAARGEIAYVLAYRKRMSAESIDAYFPNRPTPFPLSQGYFRTPRAIDAYLSYSVEKLLKGFQRLPEDPNDWVAIGAAIQSDRFIRDWWRRPSYAFGLWSQNDAELIPTLENRKRMARQGIALYREHKQTGRFPRTLPLTGEAAQDMISGRPFVYEPGVASFTLKCRQLTYAG